MLVTDRFTANTERARDLQSRAQAKIDALKADADITKDAKARRIAELRQTVNDEVSKLYAESEASIATELESARRKLFSPPVPWSATPADRVAVQSSFRNALDRADRAYADNSQTGLRHLLDQSVATSDKIQSRAILSTAYGLGLQDIVESYMSSFPEVADDVAQFAQLSEATGGAAATRRYLQFGAI